MLRGHTLFLGVLLATGCLVEVRELRPPDAEPPGAGGGAGGASDGGGGAVSCPVDMVRVEDDDLGVDFCIDRTEVTLEAYGAFLAVAEASTPAQPSACVSNRAFTNRPDGTCPDFTSASELPVHCVDWCDAWAYCDYAGKRLCRGLDGESLAWSDAAILGEWHFACSAGLTQPYPYGDSADPMACHVDGEIGKEPVGSFFGCEGGFAGIFDMQGNVSEWIDACESDAPDARCRVRGGNTYGSATQWTCDRVQNDMQVDRLDADQRVVGIRCCADPRG